MTTRQLVIFAALVVALTLSLAWLIERRQVLSLRQELDRWGGQAGLDVPLPPAPPAEPRDPNGPVVGWPEDEEGL